VLQWDNIDYVFSKTTLYAINTSILNKLKITTKLNALTTNRCFNNCRLSRIDVDGLLQEGDKII